VHTPVGRSEAHIVCILLVLGALAGMTPAANLRVWNGDIAAAHLDLAYEDAKAKKLQPVRIVAARNGTFSGKIVIGSDAPIKDLRASLGRLSGDGESFIPADRVTLSYPQWKQQGEWKVVPDAISQFDTLHPAPADEIPLIVKSVRRKPVPLGYACQPIWITVRVPADCAAGHYKGVLTITAAKSKPVRVAVRVEVLDWRLPDPGGFQTFVELIQSPESVAMRYEAPLWSDRHFELIGKSLRLTGQVGNRSAYIPLICQTNFGNEESMVRWIPRRDGTYAYDFTVMEKYLDVVQEHMGRPKLVVLYVWDLFLEGGQFAGDLRFCPKEVQEARLAYKGKGPMVSVVKGRSAKCEPVMLPQYSDPESKKLWKPLLEQLQSRIADRGLTDAVMLGISTDAIPSPEVVGLFAELLPGVEWVHHSHGFWGGRDKKIAAAGSRIGYAAIVGGHWATDRPGKHSYGWQKPWVHFHRALRDNHPVHMFRILGEVNLAGERKGFGRLGADFWPVLKDRRGRMRGRLNGRYPKSMWRNLMILTTLLAPGKNGALPTARYELCREGVQECEARIFIEQAIVDPKLRAKLGPELASKAQKVLDARSDMLRKSIAGGVGGVQFNCPKQEGYEAYLKSDWPALSEHLYDAASQVAKAIGRQGGDEPLEVAAN